jgi:hypothetical protein
VRTSKSGGIGSKEALGRAAGIVVVRDYHEEVAYLVWGCKSRYHLRGVVAVVNE